MTLKKSTQIYDSVQTRSSTASVTTAKPVKKKPSVGAQLTALAIEIPPVAYVAITGTVPVWIRSWLIGWLSVWLIVTVVTAINAGSTS